MVLLKKEHTRLIRQGKSVDKNLLYLILALVFLGLVFVIDSSAPHALKNFGDKFYFLKQQSVWAVIGLLIMFIVSKIKYTFWEKVSLPFFAGSMILLICVLIPSLSYKALGARRWLDLGFFSLQPSELIKFSLASYFALLTKSKKGIFSFLLPLALIIFLVMLQPDLGTVIIISIIAFSQILVSEVKTFHLIGGILAAVVSGVILILISPYRMDRLNTFLQSTTDPLGKGYHIRQVLLGLGSGGIFGVGIGSSRQKYLFLPEASTDSIFSVLGEELGFIGGTALIAAFAYFAFLGFRIAMRSSDVFSKAMAVGITAWISGQALVNISSMVALTPLTGVPLPFFSYGGSSLVMVLAGCGILLSISREMKVEPKKKRYGR